MIEKLDLLEQRYRELGLTISDPNVIAKQDEWQELMKEHAHIQPIVEKYREYKDILKEIDDLRSLLAEGQEDEFQSLVEEELKAFEEKGEAVGKELQFLLLPKDSKR